MAGRVRSPLRSRVSLTLAPPRRSPRRSACTRAPWCPRPSDGRRAWASRSEAHDHDLAEAERHRLLDDPALLVLRRVRLGVMLGDVDAGDDHGPIARPYFLDAAALAAVLARDDHHLVAFAQAHATRHV